MLEGENHRVSGEHTADGLDIGAGKEQVHQKQKEEALSFSVLPLLSIDDT